MLGGGSTAPLDGSLLPAAPAPPDDVIGSMLTWSTDDVCRWLHSVDLGVFEKQFREHQITGEILPLLTLVECRDMDIRLVGPRTRLMRQLSKLKRAYVNYQRNRAIWSGLEQRYTTPFGCLVDHAVSCCCPDPPDKYSITSSHLKLTHKVYPLGKVRAGAARREALPRVARASRWCARRVPSGGRRAAVSPRAQRSTRST